MNDASLQGVRIFVAEDEFLLALDLCDILTGAGAQVVGPARSPTEAAAMLAAQAPVDVALLDLNLAGESSESIAVTLHGQGVPVILTTGYDAEDVPEALKGLLVCVKPLAAGVVLRAVKQALDGNQSLDQSISSE